MDSIKIDQNLFQAYKDTYGKLADDIQFLHKKANEIHEISNKIVCLNELADAIEAFDVHVKSMVRTFPTYYFSYKEFIDNLLSQNANYLAATSSEAILLLEKSKTLN